MIRFTVALGAAVVALSALAFSKHQEEGRLRTALADRQACLTALAGSDTAPVGLRCPAPVSAVHRTARASAACDTALLNADLFGVGVSCSTEVKTVLAERNAESRRAEGLSDLLKQERADQAAAITRAEVRARTQTERSLRASAAIAAAPRHDGLLVLDADRLRQLGAEDAAAGRRP